MTAAPVASQGSRPQQLTCRRANAMDDGGVARMLDRCSPASLCSRFHSAADHAGAAQWFSAALCNGLTRVWILEHGRGRVLAVGDATQEGPWHEAGLLVADPWQRKGLGTLLMAHLLADLRADGADTIRLTTRVEGLPFVWAIKRRLGLSTEKCVTTWGEADVYLSIVGSAWALQVPTTVMPKRRAAWA